MTVFTYSRVPAFNPNTSPASVAKSASGNVYDKGDTGFTTPLNLTLVATGTVTITLISDANGMFPDFTLVDRTECVFKSGSQKMALTTTTPIPGPTGDDGTPGLSVTSAAAVAGNLVLGLSDSTTLAPVPLPTGAAIDDSSIAYQVGNGTLTKAQLNATFVPKWKPTTAYLAGDAVLSPAGDTVTAIANFTSGASYNSANWNLSGSYPAKADVAPKWKATTAYASGQQVISPNGDIVSAKTAFTSGASYDAANWNLSNTFLTNLAYNNSQSPSNTAPRIPAAPVVKMVQGCAAGHTWTLSGASANSNLNNTLSNVNSTDQVELGSQAVKVVTNGLGNVSTGATATFAAFDATTCDIRIWFYLAGSVTASTLNIINVAVFDNAAGSKSKDLYVLPTNTTGASVQAGRWNHIDVPMAALSGTVDLVNLTSIRIRCTDTGAPVTFYIGGAAFVKRNFTGRFPNGVVSLTADDSFGTQWSVLKPALDARGWKMTLFPIIDQVDAPNNLTTAQVIALRDQGHEIGAHASTGVVHGIGHQNMTHAERQTEYATMRAWMATNGFYSPSFAWPLGSHDYASELDLKQFYSVGRLATHQHIMPQYPATPHCLDSINAGSQYSLIATQLPLVAAAGGWLTITLHQIKDSGGTGNDITTAQMNTMLDNIAASGCSVMPMGDVIRTLSA